MKREDRAFASVIEVRADGDEHVIVGRAVPFNSLSVDLGGFFEEFHRGAFGDVTKLDIPMLWSHDSAQPMGRQPNNLRLHEEKDGVYFRLVPLKSQTQQERTELISEGILGGVSFGFSVNEGGERVVKMEDGRLVRQVTSATLQEISPVTFPAYKETDVSVAMRSIDVWRESQTRPVAALAMRERQQRIRELESA